MSLNNRNTIVKINMLKTVKGASDQVHVFTYEKGKDYEVSQILAETLVNNGDATIVEDANALNNKNNKQSQAPLNKALNNNDYSNKSAAADKAAADEKKSEAQKGVNSKSTK